MESSVTSSFPGVPRNSCSLVIYVLAFAHSSESCSQLPYVEVPPRLGVSLAAEEELRMVAMFFPSNTVKPCLGTIWPAGIPPGGPPLFRYTSSEQKPR